MLGAGTAEKVLFAGFSWSYVLYDQAETTPQDRSGNERLAREEDRRAPRTTAPTHQDAEGPRRRPQAPRHVHRRHRRRLGPAPHDLRGRRQRHRRGPGRPRHGVHASRSMPTARAPCATTAAASRPASRPTTTTIRSARRPRSCSPSCTPAASSTRTPTRSRAACTASASRSSTRCRPGCAARIWREGKEHFIEFRDGVAGGAAEGRRRRQGRARHRGDRSCRAPNTFTQDRVRLRHARASPARAGVPQLRRQDRADRRAPRRHEARGDAATTAARRRSCAISTAPSRR